MEPKIWILFIVGLVPLLIGFLYYNENVLGKKWMAVNGFTTEDLQGGNMVIIFLLTYLFGVMLSFGLMGSVVHQSALYSLLMVDPTATSEEMFIEVMNQFGDRYRTFGHGALHGALVGVMVALPIIGTNALFEKRGWTYVWIHVLYWIITIAIMGGIICALI